MLVRDGPSSSSLLLSKPSLLDVEIKGLVVTGLSICSSHRLHLDLELLSASEKSRCTFIVNLLPLALSSNGVSALFTSLAPSPAFFGEETARWAWAQH